MSEIQRDCAFHKNDSVEHGCVALNKLYCAIEDEPCKFKRPKSFQIPDPIKKPLKRIETDDTPQK